MKDALELKNMIIDFLRENGAEDPETELENMYNQKAEQNAILKYNKQVAYHTIAQELGALKRTSSGGAQATPLTIDEALTAGKQNFNISGYIVSDLDNPYIHHFESANGSGSMQWVTIADKTGTMDITVFGDQFDKIDGVNTGDFVTASNLWWSKPGEFSPQLGKFSSMTKTKAEFEMTELSGANINDVKVGDRTVIKGIFPFIAPDDLRDVLHCAGGHWFKNIDESKIGELSHCEKCGDVTEVMQSTVTGQEGLDFATIDGSIVMDISVFSTIVDGVEAIQDYLVSGQVVEKDDGSRGFRANLVLPVKKN